jgi:multidrug efflux pump subunit AcrB
MWLTRLALKNPILILMLSLMVTALGMVSFQRLSVDLFPDITLPVIRVATFYPGAGPADIEKTITVPVERAVSAAPGVARVESSSRQGVSIVSAWFSFDTNLDNAQFEVAQRVSQVMNQLPPGIQQPFIIKFDVSNIPVVQVALSSKELDELQLYDLAYNVIGPQLERIPGVASVSVGGGKVRSIEVMAQRDALRARGLGVLDLVNAVRTTNLLLPSGRLRAGSRDYNVFSNTQVDRAKPLRDVILRPGSTEQAGVRSAPVRLGDVARIEDTSADQTEIVRINGARGVYIRVQKQPGANTIAVVDGVRRILPQLRGVPASVSVGLGFDQSNYIRAAMTSLQHEAVQGGLLAIAIILIFLVSFRATAIVAVAIPLSIVATFMLLYFTGQTLNVFTLGGLALGVGRLVDDSIVELENIYRHLALGQDRRSAVLAAAQEVAMPILVSTITTIVVFFPVLFLIGVARELFMPLAATIAFALMMSFFVSRTVTPLLCLYSLRVPPAGTAPHGFRGAVLGALARVDGAYAGALGWVLRHRAVTVIGILALFGASLTLLRGIGTEFFPDSDESQFRILVRTPVGTRVEKTEKTAIKIEDQIERSIGGRGGRRAMYNTILTDVGIPSGRAALFVPNTGPHSGTVQVNLLPPGERPLSEAAAVAKLRRELADGFPGTRLIFSTGGIVKRILNFGSDAPIDIEILGHDLEKGAEYAKRLLSRLRRLRDKDAQPLLTDLLISREENYPELNVVVDREKASALGISQQEVAQSVLTSLVGNSQFAPVPFTDPRSGEEYFINVRLDDPFRGRIRDLHEVLLRAPGGRVVTLDAVAKVERGSGPVLINRKYMQRIINITANVSLGGSLGEASAAAERTIAENPPPDGFSAGLSGQTQAQREAFSGLRFAALMAIVLVYMVLASQFKSLLYPLVIMFSVPLGVGGVFVMLYLTGTTLSVNSFMGIIMMVGIVVSNGVLLVDFANLLRAKGMPMREALIEAGRTRLRPILMTTLATIVGLAPMAIGFGEGSETNLPLARAVIGGLTVSTFFTLFLVPSLYSALDRFSRRKLERTEEL